MKDSIMLVRVIEGLYEGKSKASIADSLSISREKVNRLLSSVKARDILKVITGTLTKDLLSSQKSALDNIIEKVKSKNDNVSLKASIFLLNFYMSNRVDLMHTFTKEREGIDKYASLDDRYMNINYDIVDDSSDIGLGRE